MQWFGALAAGLIVAIGGFLLGHSWPRAPDLRAELVSASVRAVLSAHPIDVVSSDHHTVKPWLSGQLPFSPPVPELSAAGRRAAGRAGSTISGPTGWPRWSTSTAITRSMSTSGRATPCGGAAGDGAIDGYHLTTARVGSFIAVMVSDMSVEELARFAIAGAWPPAPQPTPASTESDD